MLAGGAGPDAVFAPEMAAFARALGFKFMAHRVNDPDRKARIERPFAWIEGNFLPGRSFSSFDDLNAQALAWCTDVANAKPKRSLGMAPEAAYVMEKPYLTSLSAVLPAVYEVFERVVDLYGFVSVDTNRYSTPERLVVKTVTVYKHYASIEIHYKRGLVASHPRLVGVRDARNTLPGHHTIRVRLGPCPLVATRQVRNFQKNTIVATLKNPQPTNNCANGGSDSGEHKWVRNCERR